MKKIVGSFLFSTAFTLVSGVTYADQNPIRVVTDATFPPMEYVDSGKKTGFDIDLFEALAKQMNRPIEWIDIDFKGLIPAILSDRADAAISAIYITPEREKVVDFTDPYYKGGLVIVTTKESLLNSIGDLLDKKVTVQVGTKSVNYLTTTYPKINRVEVEKNEEMFNLVKIGRADAAVTGKPAAKLYAQKNPGMKVLDQQITTEEYGIAVGKNDIKLKNELNNALKEIKANGIYQQLVNKWFEAK